MGLRHIQFPVQVSTPDGWKTVGKATTYEGAKRIAKREYGPWKWGHMRNPDTDLKYGLIRSLGISSPCEAAIYWNHYINDYSTREEDNA